MSQKNGIKRTQKRETSDLKVSTEWTQKWISPKQIRKNENLCINEKVRGPFSSPKLLTTQPIIKVTPCQQVANANENCNNLRCGIPNIWKEYLARNGFCNPVEAYILRKNSIPSYIRSFATDGIWNELGLPLVQGIPDPWKCKFFPQKRSVKCLRQRCAYNDNSSTQIACVYDGDDEAEIEHSVKSQFNDLVDNKEDLFQEENKELCSPLAKQITLQTYKNNSKGIKKCTKRKQAEKFIPNIRTVNNKKDKKILPVCKDMIPKQQKFDNKISCWQKHENNFKFKLIKNNVHRAKGNMHTDRRDGIERSRDSIYENCFEKNVLSHSNILCCNCTLQNHAHSNLKGFAEHTTNRIEGANILNRVLCKNCENIYYNRNSQKPDPKNILQNKIIKQGNIHDRTKHKLCTCFERTKEWFKKENLVKTKEEVAVEEGLKLICSRCNNPYLKIATIRANASDQKKNSCISKRKEPNKAKDDVSKYPITQKRSKIIARNYDNYNAICIKSKTDAPKENFRQCSRFTKQRDNMSKEYVNRVCTKYNYIDNASRNEALKVNRSKNINLHTENAILANFDDDTASEEIIEVCKTKIIPKNVKHNGCRKRVPKDHFYDTEEKIKNMKDRNKNSTMLLDKETKIKECQPVKCEPTLKCTVSDSGEYADVSDNFIDSSTSVAAQDKLSVTSITFIRRLNGTIPIRKLCRRTKLKKAYRFQKISKKKVIDCKQVLKTEDEIANCDENNIVCNTLFCYDLGNNNTNKEI